MYTKDQQNIIFFIYLFFLNIEFDGFFNKRLEIYMWQLWRNQQKIETFDFIDIIDFKLHIIDDIIDLTILPWW